MLLLMTLEFGPGGGGEDPVYRLQLLESEIAKLKAPPLLWLEILKALSPLITGLFLLGVGYQLTGSIENALAQKEHQLSNVKEMREIILKLESSETSLNEAMANVRTLSAFGTAAIPPLISMLGSSGDTKILAAQEGLRAIALYDRLEVCVRLTKIVNNRTRLFSWEAHRWAIKLIGELDCREAETLKALESYLALLEGSTQAPGFAPYSRTVREIPEISERSFEQIREELDVSRGLLAGAAMAAH